MTHSKKSYLPSTSSFPTSVCGPIYQSRLTDLSGKASTSVVLPGENSAQGTLDVPQATQ